MGSMLRLRENLVAPSEPLRDSPANRRRAGVRFVVLLGLVSLFADMTYEGARSVAGPFLGLLGASAAIVAVVAGLGELIGYGLRLVSGYVADRSKSYWPITIVGYASTCWQCPCSPWPARGRSRWR
jgi:hypothetical protein